MYRFYWTCTATESFPIRHSTYTPYILSVRKASTAQYSHDSDCNLSYLSWDLNDTMLVRLDTCDCDFIPPVRAYAQPPILTYKKTQQQKSSCVQQTTSQPDFYEYYTPDSGNQDKYYTRWRQHNCLVDVSPNILC